MKVQEIENVSEAQNWRILVEFIDKSNGKSHICCISSWIFKKRGHYIRIPDTVHSSSFSCLLAPACTGTSDGTARLYF